MVALLTYLRSLYCTFSTVHVDSVYICACTCECRLRHDKEMKVIHENGMAVTVATALLSCYSRLIFKGIARTGKHLRLGFVEKMETIGNNMLHR